MEEKRLNFFADIDKQIFVIIGGLIAVSTLVPLFINQLGSIFGFSISISYYLFIFIYFAFPVIFYLLYCSIYDYVGFMKLIPSTLYSKLDPSKWKIIESVFIMLIFLWLCWGNLYSKLGAVLLYAISLIIFFWFLFSKSFKEVNNSRKEFIIIGVSIIAIFSLFLFSRSRLKIFEEPGYEKYKLLNEYGSNINDVAFNVFSKQKQMPEKLIKPIDSLIEQFQSEVIKVSIQNPNRKYGIQKLDKRDSAAFNDVFLAIKAFRSRNICSVDAGVLRDTILSVSNALWPCNSTPNIKGDTSYKLYQTFLSVQSYLQLSVQEKSSTVKKYWALLLSNLQVKGISWFFFLVIVCLCLWLQNMKDLSDKKNNKIILSDKAKENNATEIIKIQDNSNQIRSLFYMSLLLVMPFFKNIDEKTIKLSMPFVDFSIGDLYKPSASVDKGDTDYKDEFEKIRIQINLVSENLQKFENEQIKENEKNRARLEIISGYTIDDLSGKDKEKYDSIDR